MFVGLWGYFVVVVLHVKATWISLCFGKALAPSPVFFRGDFHSVSTVQEPHFFCSEML